VNFHNKQAQEPMDRDYILAPSLASTEFETLPAYLQLESLELINEVEGLSGLGSWVTETYAAMSPRLREQHLIALQPAVMLLYKGTPLASPNLNLIDYVQQLRNQDVGTLIRSGISALHEKCGIHHLDKVALLPPIATIWEDESAFIRFMNILAERPNSDHVWAEAFALIQQPAQYLNFMIEHIRLMWDHYLKAEWEAQLPTLRESVQAFRRMQYPKLTVLEAIRTVTDRDMQDKMKGEELEAERIVFVPSPHNGPYIGRTLIKETRTLYVLFGARLPRGYQSHSSQFGRSEVLIRMNALADDTRLRILELLTAHKELCSQDIIEMLGMSQSSVSRHLSQLTASGFLIERRREINKCYSLNTDRVIDTVRVLTNFLTRQY
jgi:ArsR family transcriptional regulator